MKRVNRSSSNGTKGSAILFGGLFIAILIVVIIILFKLIEGAPAHPILSFLAAAALIGVVGLLVAISFS